MLSESTPSSSAENPLPISEMSADFDILLLIITGRPQETINRHKNWAQATRLYRMMEKYQLDGHQPWFSDMCVAWLHEYPLAALFLACNRPTIDTTLARHAIADGLAKIDAANLHRANPAFFREECRSSGSDYRRWLFDPANTTVRFGLNLGYKGLLAYNYTFAGLAPTPSASHASSMYACSSTSRPAETDWQALAAKFVETVKQVELEMSARGVSRTY
ncbi:hypothetical protein QFC20_005305 [Naganishia adeliensis]|uniref:Uncharacterized protein n=1 Tax=Naganishia adeliensis TaxID=92952 RepID=A0ACC2VQV7_9TREE|nr:hypothetical protein QFC20_005305 [Naganishia adeliensis]